MYSLHHFLIFAILSSISSKHTSAAQSDFEQVLLQVFQSGLFGTQPDGAGAAGFPQVTLQPSLHPGEELFQSPEPSLQMSPDIFPSASFDLAGDFLLDGSMGPMLPTTGFLEEFFPSASPALEISQDGDDIGPQPSAVALLPDASMEFDLTESPEGTFGPGEGSIDAVVNIFDPISINCGSFDVRNTFGLDTEPFFNNDSFVFSDTFAKTHFGSLEDQLLYSTYRSADANLTYTVPVEASGVWMVTLLWAEISPLFMREGARVFTVSINGQELESSIDVFRDSAFGSFSPLGRTFIVDVTSDTVSIALVPLVGQPMLSAFQLTYMSPL